MKADAFEEALAKAEQKLMARLTSPAKIQEFLDQTSYSTRTSIGARSGFFGAQGSLL